MTRTMGWIGAGLVVALAGCAPQEIPEDRFADQGAQLYCQRTRECALGDFKASYYGMADCREHVARDLEELVEFADDIDCDYDPDGAARAWNNLAEMSCENFYEGGFFEDFDKIWDDCVLNFYF